MSLHEIDVLLVEDQPTDAELVLWALWRQLPRERVEWVRDGELALARLRELRAAAGLDLPRLVLLDLKLPRVSGLEVTSNIRADESLCRVPIVILSSSADETDMARAYRCGVNSYIVKPVDIDELDAAVRQVTSYWLGLNRVAG